MSDGADISSRHTRDGREILPPGTVLGGRFRIVRTLGWGGVGVVYEGENTVLSKRVALKFLRPSVLREQSMVKRFLGEARAAALIDHEHVVQVMDFVHLDGGTLFMVMEYLEGQDLHTLVYEEGAQSLRRSVHILAQICRALTVAHEKGIVHRDLKPANIFLVDRDSDPDFVKILDFGISKFLNGDPSSPTTQAGVILGTPQYMAPEQWDSRLGVDHRADIYALGVMLSKLLTGQTVFEADGRAALMNKALFDAPPSLLDRRPDLPSGVDEVYQRLLAKKPEDRYGSCAEVERALLALCRDANPYRVAATEPLAGRGGGDNALPITLVLKGNLRTENDLFIGRDAELEALDREVLGGRHLITLHGPAGVGKTRLARRYAELRRADHPGGVWFCDFGDARTEAGVLQAMALALGVPLTQHDPAMQLENAIAGRGRALFVLDNFEHVIAEAAEIVDAWRGESPEAVFLITSRVPLRWTGEEILAVGPLPSDDAISLFYARAHSLRSDLVRTADNAPVVRQIVERLDGLSLAVELAAARVRMLTPEEILARLGDRLDFLVETRRDRATRQTTLRAAIDWSWDLLTPCECTAWSQLSVFQGGFSIEAAEAVIDLTDHHNPPWVMDAVQSLVDHSLVQTEPGHRGRTRYRMLDSLRAYASERLGDGVLEAASRHADYFARFGDEEFRGSLRYLGAVDRIADLATEMDNLVVAVNTALAVDDRAVAARCALAVSLLYMRHGPVGEGAALLGRVDGREVPDSLRAEILTARGVLLDIGGSYHEAMEHFREALALHRSEDSTAGQARTLWRIGRVLQRFGDVAEAVEHLHRALDLQRPLADPVWEGVILSDIGVFNGEYGKLDDAQACLEEALSIHREFGDHECEGTTLEHLAMIETRRGSFPTAYTYFSHAVGIHRELGNRIREGMALCRRGTALSQMGRYKEALDDYLESLTAARESGSRGLEGLVLCNVGCAMAGMGRNAEAEANLEKALAIHRQLGHIPRICVCLVELSDLYLRAQRWDDAEAALQEVLAAKITKPKVTGCCLGSLGVLRAIAGEFEQARQFVDEAESILLDVDQFELAKLHCKRARVEKRAGDLNAAERALADAEHVAEGLVLREGSELFSAIANSRAYVEGGDEAATRKRHSKDDRWR